MFRVFSGNVYHNVIYQFIALSFLLLLINNAQAAVMLSGGLTHKATLESGGSITGVLELKNTANVAAEVKIYQEDVSVNAKGGAQYTAVNRGGGHQRSNAGWIRLATNRVILAPKSKQTITYQLKVPQNARLSGSYWSVILVEPVSKKSRESQLATPQKNKPHLVVEQKVRYAVNVITRIGQEGKINLTFAAPKVEKDKTGKRMFGIDIRNTGTLYGRPKVWLDVFAANGKAMGKFTALGRGLYPNVRKRFAIDVSKLAPGNYKALLAAEDNNSGQVFGSDINLTVKR